MRRLGGRLRRVPRALLLLLAIAAVQSLAWAILMPPLQGPDELGHFAYTQKMIEARTIPWAPTEASDFTKEAVSTELRVFIDWAGVNGLRQNVSARPPGTAVSVDLWRVRDDPLTDDQRADGGYTSPMANPPLYYVYTALPYAATSPLDVFDRELAMRLWNIPILLCLVACAWLVAGELLGRGTRLQALATAAVALQPQLVHMSSVINPDLLLAAIWTAFLYVAIVALKHGAGRVHVGILVALAAASALTHARGVSIVAPLAVTLGVLAWRRGLPSLSRTAWAAAGVAVAAGAAVALVAVLNYATTGTLTLSRLRQLGSYVWQFYLPGLPSMGPPPGSDYGVRDVFVDRFWSFFGQLDVTFSPGTLDVLAWASAVAIVLAVAGLLVRYRAALVQQWAIVAVIATAAVAYLAQSHIAAFRALISTVPDPVLTGRYLLPFISIYGVAMALTVAWLPPRPRRVAAGALVGALALLQVSVLGLLVERYYA